MTDSPAAQQPTYIPKQDNKTKVQVKPLIENKKKNKHNSNVGYKETPEETALWSRIRDDYICNSELTQRQLSIKHNVNYDTLRGRVAREHWSTLRENAIKPIIEVLDNNLAEDELTTVRMTIKRTALEACNTILGIMRGTITKNASIRASTAQDMLDRAGFKQPDNIGQKLQAYTDLVKSITINVGTVVNNPIVSPNIIQGKSQICEKVVDVVSAYVPEVKSPSIERATQVFPDTTGGIKQDERLISDVMLTKQPLPVDTPTEQGLTNIPEITDTSDTEGTLALPTSKPE